MNQGHEIQNYMQKDVMEENPSMLIDLIPKEEDSISIKYEPHLLDDFHFYFSKYFLLNVVPSTAFIVLAIMGFLFMFTMGLSIDKNVLWAILGFTVLFFIVIKPFIDFVLIKIKSSEKQCCELYGDKNRIIIRTPLKEKVFKYDFLKQIIETKHGMTFKFGQIRHLYVPARIYKDNTDFEKYYKMLEKNYIV